MFDKTQPIYSRPDGSFLIDRGNGALDHLEKNDAEINYPGLWEEVMAFIAEHPERVKPEPEPEPEPEPPEPPPYDIHGFILGLMGVEIDE